MTGVAEASGATAVPVVIGTLAVVVIVLRRMRGQELRRRRLLIRPLVILIVGLAAMVPQLFGMHSFHEIDYLLAVIDLMLTLGLGAIRGLTVLVYPQDGSIWYRYGPITVGLWLLSIILRFLLGMYGAQHGATALVTSASVIAMLGLTLLVQNLIVTTRQPSLPHEPTPRTQPPTQESARRDRHR